MLQDALVKTKCYKTVLPQRSMLHAALPQRGLCHNEVLQDVSVTTKYVTRCFCHHAVGYVAGCLCHAKRSVTRCFCNVGAARCDCHSGGLSHRSMLQDVYVTASRSKVCYKTFLSQGSMLQEVRVTMENVSRCFCHIDVLQDVPATTKDVTRCLCHPEVCYKMSPSPRSVFQDVSGTTKYVTRRSCHNDVLQDVPFHNEVMWGEVCYNVSAATMSNNMFCHNEVCYKMFV